MQNSPEQGSKNSDISQQLADITDRNFLKIRIILGALFGFLLGLPIAHPALHIIYMSMNNPPAKGELMPDDVSAQSIALMVMPFLIGFSTNLVLVILSRFISSIQTVFGIPART